MSTNIETLKPNHLFDKFKLYSEPSQQNNDEIIKRKSLIHRQTKICARAVEIYTNSETSEINMVVRKKFDRRIGNMTEEISVNYKSGLSTTEIWPSSNGVKEPLSVTKKLS